MSGSSPEELEQIQDQLQDRMIRSGEWTRIQRSLQVQLNDMGWVDQVMNHAKGQSLAVCPTEPGSAADPLSSLLGNCTETANTQNPLNFDSLQDSVQNFAADTLPTDIRQAVLKEVQAYVNSQLQR